MDYSRLKAALLDFDGTLVHLPIDWQKLREQVSKAFAAHGYHSEFRPLYGEIAAAFTSLESRGVSGPVRAALRRKLNHLMTEAELASAPNAVPVPGARELLKLLSGRGWKLIIQSSNSVRCIEVTMRRLDMPPVDAIVGRESSRFPKPDPSGVRRVLRALGLRADETVVIGDGDYDVALGKAIGAATVRLRAGVGGGPRSAADCEVASLSEIAGLHVGEKKAAVGI